MFDLFEIPYTGSSAAGIISCYDKSAVRLIAQSMGVKVPGEFFVEFGGSPPWDQLRYPVLIKPNRADGSFGITKDAVIGDRRHAEDYVNFLRTNLPGRDYLVQQYLPGAEYSVGLLGNPGERLEALPVLEVDYAKLPRGLAPILSYESKTMPDSPYWTDIAYKKADLTENETRELVDVSDRLFRRLGLRDYARFDFRRDSGGEALLLEVNPNPAWEHGAKLALMAGFRNLEYRDLLGKILDAACERVGMGGRR